MYWMTQLIPASIMRGTALATLVGLWGCGGSTPTPSTPTAPTAPPALPPGVTSAMVAEGRTLYNAGSCARCHGTDGRGPTFGPDLTDQVFLHNDGAYEAIVQVITTGVPAARFRLPTSQAAFEMFPRGGMSLTDAQVRALAAYVWTLSHPS